MRKVLLIVFALGFAVQVWGQETKVFTLDLGEPHKESITVEGDNSTRLVIKTKELLAFKLKNGNPYKYKYVINHKLVDFFEGQGYNPLDSMGQVLVGNNAVANGNNIIEERLDTAQIKAAIKELEEERATLVKNKESGLKGVWDFKINNIDRRIEGLKKALELSKNQSKGEYISKSVYATYFINSVKLNNLLKAVTKTAKATNEDEDKKNIENAAIVLKQAFEDLKIDIQKYVAEISAEDFLNHTEFMGKRQEFNSLYINLLQNTQEISKEAGNFPDVLDSFNKSIKNINPISSDIKDEIAKMYQLKLHNYLLPIDINGKNIDAVEITVERYDKNASNPTPDKYSYNIWVKGGLKIDVSGGLFITSLMDKEYETQGSGTSTLIYEKNKGNYDFGFGSTINISVRGGSWVRPALNVGALFTANQKFQILSGLGLILGKEERIVLHAGLAMGTVSKISDNYKADGSTAYDLGASGAVPTTNKFSFGHFFGITYNFGKVKKAEGK
jgi:tetratricopeptide (TPR) repeat protein